MPKNFYTQNGWEGKKYEQTKSLPLKVIAKQIKDQALKEYPQLGISATTQHFSGGCSISIRVTKVPEGMKVMQKRLQYPEYQGKPDSEVPRWAWGWEYTPEFQVIMDRIKAIGDEYRYDDSDGMIDYFNTNFYYHVDLDYEIQHKAYVELGLQ